MAQPPVPLKAGGKIGMTKIGNTAVAKAPEPSTEIASGENRAQYRTYFTPVPRVGESPQPIYEADRQWTRVTLVLETAGPVAVGEQSKLAPVTSGKGILLETGVPMFFDVCKGNKLYVAATAVNRIKVMAQPLPWMEQVTAYISSAVDKLGKFLGK